MFSRRTHLPNLMALAPKSTAFLRASVLASASLACASVSLILQDKPLTIPKDLFGTVAKSSSSTSVT